MYLYTSRKVSKEVILVKVILLTNLKLQIFALHHALKYGVKMYMNSNQIGSANNNPAAYLPFGIGP